MHGKRRCIAVCRYGYRGFYDRHDKPVVLTRRSVDGIQLQGGTILGTSRGGADIKCGLRTLQPKLWMVCHEAGWHTVLPAVVVDR